MLLSLDFHTTLVLLGLCCLMLMVGFAYRDQNWAPWLMLVAVITLLGLMSWCIFNQIYG